MEATLFIDSNKTFQLRLHSYIACLIPNKDMSCYLAPSGTVESIQIQQANGWISSPDKDLDGLYDMNVFYEWSVKHGGFSTVIGFQVLFVEIQYSPACLHDFLWVRANNTPARSV